MHYYEFRALIKSLTTNHRLHTSYAMFHFATVIFALLAGVYSIVTWRFGYNLNLTSAFSHPLFLCLLYFLLPFPGSLKLDDPRARVRRYLR